MSLGKREQLSYFRTLIADHLGNMVVWSHIGGYSIRTGI